MINYNDTTSTSSSITSNFLYGGAIGDNIAFTTNNTIGKEIAVRYIYIN